MEELICENGSLTIPERFMLSKERGKKRLKITTPWMVEVRTTKDFFTESRQTWFRHKPDKPYIPEGFIEYDNERFKVIEVRT